MAYIPPNSNGQATMANSSPVVIASNQTAIPITDNSGSLTVDGTVAATQSGTWTVQPGNTANTTAWKVDGSAVTQPVSAASLPLPSGAATAAKQPALGTAGSASTDVITVQGIASGTAQPVSGAVADAATASGNPVPAGAIYESTLPTYTTGQRSTLHTGSRGSLKIELAVPDSSTQVAFTSAADGQANPGVASRLETISRGSVWNGSTWDRQAGSTGGSFVHGAIAHDGIDSGNPIKIGGKASSTLPTAVAANDRVDALFDLVGRQVTAQKSVTSTLSNVAGSITSVTVLAANTARLGATIQNDSAAILYLKFGATASTTSYTVQMAANSYYEIPFGYTGILDGIWSSATGSARVTELS